MHRWVTQFILAVGLGFVVSASAVEAGQATSRPRVLLITSLAPPSEEALAKMPRVFRPGIRNARFKAERIFRQFFHGEDVELAVIHEANAYDTWHAIQAPGNVAVFWFSHAGYGEGLLADVIQDANGNNVAPVFQALHPETQVLALVGCNAKAIGEHFTELGMFDHNPGLRVLGGEPMVEAYYGLEKSLREALPLIRDAAARRARLQKKATPPARACEARSGYPIRIARALDPTIPRDVTTPPVIVTLGGKLVTVFEPARAGEEQQRTVGWIPLKKGELPRAAQLKIALDGGAQASRDPRWLGDYEIQGSWPDARWDLFTKPGTKEPMGVHTRVYRYRGPLDFAGTTDAQSFLPPECEVGEPVAPSQALAPTARDVFGALRHAAGVGAASDDAKWVRVSVGGPRRQYKQIALLYGRLSADAQLKLDDDRWKRLPYLDLELTGLVAGLSESDGAHAALRLGTVEVSRDLPLDEERVIRVDILGTQLEAHLPFTPEADPKAKAFLSVVADMIGYKSVLRMREDADFHGLHLASSRTEAGLALKLSENLRSRILLGAESDLSLGFKQGWSPAVYSKFRFYGQVRADIENLRKHYRVSAFAEASAPIALESGEDAETELRLIGGLIVGR